MEIKYEKTYNIAEGFHKGIKRFFVVCDGRKIDLHYANAKFALEKAEGFTKHCYKDFIDFRGNQIKFTFKKS